MKNSARIYRGAHHMIRRTIGRAAVLAIGLSLCPAAGSAQQIQYYHLDPIGNVRAVTNQTGQVIERHDYLPFGEECVTGPCAGNTPAGAGQPKKFTGKERDKETGLDYFGARYYGSKIARFTTVDPVYNWRENLVDPQRWNRYAYVGNNPLRRVDPDGRDWTDSLAGFAEGVAIGYVEATVGPFIAPYADALDPVGSIKSAAQTVSSFAHAGDALDQYVKMSTSQNPADHAALGRIIGVGTVNAGAGVAAGELVARGPYGHISDGPSVGPGGLFTSSQKAKIYEANRARTSGTLRSDLSGNELGPSAKSTKGVRTPSNAAQVDHHKARSKGGSNSFRNARVLSAEENRRKGAN